MRYRLPIAIVCFFLAVLLGVYLELRQEPRIVQASHQDTPNGIAQAFSSFPLDLEEGRWNKRIHVRLRLLDPKDDLLVGFDDCLMRVLIDGVPYQQPSRPVCSWTRIVRIELPDKSANFHDVQFWIRNTGGPGGMKLRIAPSHTFLVIIRTAISLLFLGSLLVFFSRQKKTLWLVLTAWSGIVLRLLYFWNQSIYEKTNDLNAHLEYIQHLRNTWSIPNVANCWECYSPPLYYALARIWEAVFSLLCSSLNQSLHVIAIFSLFVSIAAFLLSLAIGQQLFCTTKSRDFISYILLTASLPAVVFQSTRITSDGLQYAWGALCLYGLLLWWRNPTLLSWGLVSIAVSAAVLTKGNGFVLLVAVMLLALLQKRLLMRSRLFSVLIFSLIFSALTGWYFQARFFRESGNWLFGPVNEMSSRLKVENKLSGFLVFNPRQVLKNVYNSPTKKEFRPSYHFEYLYRAAYLGEFDWGKKLRFPAKLMLLMGFVLLLLAALGLLKSIRTRFFEDLPLYMLSAGLLGASVYYRLSYAYANTSDFRFLLPFVLPLSYFAVLGSNSTRPVLRHLGSILILLHVACCWFFTVLVCLGYS